MKKLILIALFVSVGLLVSSGLVFAAGATGSPSSPGATGSPNPEPKTTTQPTQKLQNPLKVDSISAVILLVVDIMVYVGVSFAILAIIFVGFKFVMAQGNPAEITKAKEWFLYIIIGLAVLISSKVIVEIVKNTLIKSGVVDNNFLGGNDNFQSAPIRKGDNIDASYRPGIDS